MNMLKYGAISAIILLSPMTAQAGPREDVLNAMSACASVTDEHARLACYDQLAPQVKSALAAPARHAPTPEEQKSWFGFDMGDLFGTSPKAQTTPQQFGSEALPPAPPAPGEPAPPEPIDSITAKVTDYAISPFKKFVVFLDNGQVWQQLQGDTEIANFSKHGNSVSISRGLIGSYNMTIGDSNKVYKVKRIK